MGIPTTSHDLFTPRQLTALTTFSDLVQEARQNWRYVSDATGGRSRENDDVPLREGGSGACAYGEAVSVYLAFGCGSRVRLTFGQA